MKILTSLSATAVEGEYTERHGILNNVTEEPARGFFRVASLSAGGLLLKRGEAQVVIPLAELWRLVETHEPALSPPAPVETIRPGGAGGTASPILES